MKKNLLPRKTSAGKLQQPLRHGALWRSRNQTASSAGRLAARRGAKRMAKQRHMS